MSSSRRSRTGLFVPDERGIGGALEVAEEYRHFFASQLSSHRQSAPRTYAPTLPSAQQLSFQRAMKQATSDTVTHDHLVRLSHMFRRVAAPSSSSSGGASGRPHVMAQQSASHPRRLRPQSATADLCAWVPRSAGSSEHRLTHSRRPTTAPDQLHSSSRLTGSSASLHCDSSSSGQQRRDWQQLKAAAHPQPQPPVQPVQLPPSNFYAGPNLLPSVQHRLFKATLMSDILQRQLYKAADIRQLCVAFVQRNPVEHRALARQVAASVLTELDVPFTSELDC